VLKDLAGACAFAVGDPELINASGLLALLNEYANLDTKIIIPADRRPNYKLSGRSLHYARTACLAWSC
jgi:hypothetical protein